MTPQDLKTLIESDNVASSLAASDQWTACAERVSAIAQPLRGAIPAQDVLRAAALDGSLARITLTARESSAAPDELKGACVTFLRWMDHEWPLDIDLPQVQAMLNGMIEAGLVSAENAMALKQMANIPQVITAIECRVAMLGF